MTDTPLARCPFAQCGGKGYVSNVKDDYLVCCAKCPSFHCTPPFDTPAEAIAYWNDRSDGARFRVGQEVVHRTLNERCTVVETYPAYSVRRSANGVVIPMLSEGALRPAPDPLPPDHIDRFWRVGARIRHIESDRGFYLSVIAFDTAYSHTAKTEMKRCNARKTGWSFDPSSPIQEENEI